MENGFFCFTIDLFKELFTRMKYWFRPCGNFHRFSAQWFLSDESLTVFYLKGFETLDDRPFIFLQVDHDRI